MKSLIYGLRVDLEQPLRATGDEREDYPTLAYATSAEAKREIEEAVIACLRRLDADCVDCEVMTTMVQDNE